MEFCVLGLLMIRPMSIYELNKAFTTTISLFYSASLGSLRTATGKLLARGLVERSPERVGGRLKKIFTITAAGREAFSAEFSTPIASARLEQTALARLHFLGLLSGATARRAALEVITAAIGESLATLEALDRDVSHRTADLSTKERTIAAYQLKTLEYGIKTSRFALEWFQGIDPNM